MSVPGCSASRTGCPGLGVSQIAAFCAAIAAPSRRRSNSAAARRPSVSEMRSRAPPSAGFTSMRSGSVSGALFASGAGSALEMPRKGEYTLIRARPSRTCSVAV